MYIITLDQVCTKNLQEDMDLIPCWLHIITMQLCIWSFCRIGYIPYHCGNFAQLPNISWDIFVHCHFPAFPSLHQIVKNTWDFMGLAANKDSLMNVPILLGNVCKGRTFSFFSLQLNKWLNAELSESSQRVPRPWGALT